MWSRNKANLYIQDALDDFHYDPKALPSPIAQRKIYRNKLMLTHLIGFGGGAAGLSGTSWFFNNAGHLETPTDAGFQFAGGSFVVDFWARFISLTNNEACVAQWDYSNDQRSWGVNIHPTTIKLNINTSGLDGGSVQKFQTVSAFSNDTWYHIAVLSTGDNVYHFLDGSQQGTEISSTEVLHNSTSPLSVGGNNIGPDNSRDDTVQGYLDEIRISKGTDRSWTGGFTPSTVEYSSDGNTSLLIHGSEVVGGGTFTESSSNTHTMTASGDAVQDTGVFKIAEL